MAKTVTDRGLAVVLLLSPALGWAAVPAPIQVAEAAGIFQLVQEREGRSACWGVVIRLNRLAFRPSIEPAQLAIRDEEDDRELRDTRRWAVDRAGKQLTIQWQPGKGDFGTGNGIRVCVERSAFRDGSQARAG
jgi:hypothetical protein